ncbi:integrin beta-7 [Eudromia elegans]
MQPPPLTPPAGPCVPRAPCDACIRSHPQCAWCMDPGFVRGGRAEATRCGPRAALERLGCPPGAILEPRGHVRVLQDEELGGGAQLGPRAVTVTLRPGEEQSFEVRVRRGAARPVDLYYLLDLSYSMKGDLEHVGGLGRAVPAALANATPSVRVGFGTFVDKPVLPYVSAGPCPERRGGCAAPAAFRHVQPLTGDGSEFARRVGRPRVAANLDAPEGGLDAVLQVALCQERIGWRQGTRLLLLASDDAFHTAGDGKLGGIVTPSDGRCHLDASGVYSESHLYDYPSVGHVAQALAAADIQPIFAVRGPALPLYQELSRLIPGSAVRELHEGSSNVLQLIADAYESLSSTVELRHSALPPGVTLRYESHCGGPPAPPRPHGGFCAGVRMGQQVTFTVRVRAQGCLAAPQAVGLRVPGLAERLRLELRSLCACPPRAPCSSSLNCSGACECHRGPPCTGREERGCHQRRPQRGLRGRGPSRAGKTGPAELLPPPSPPCPPVITSRNKPG